MTERPANTKHARRVLAVLDLFRGDGVREVGLRYGLARSDVYKFRRRALTAINQALTDQR